MCKNQYLFYYKTAEDNSYFVNFIWNHFGRTLGDYLDPQRKSQRQGNSQSSNRASVLAFDLADEDEDEFLTISRHHSLAAAANNQQQD